MAANTVSDISGWVALAGDYKIHPTFEGMQNADWVVIGGGFTGLAAARRLAELAPSDSRILLIDAKRIAQGASGRNSGFAVANESPGHAAIATAHGRADYAALNTLDHAGIKELKRLVKYHDIECQWEDTGSIHAAASPQNFHILRSHAQAFIDMGIDAELLDEDALATRLGTRHYKLGVLSKGGALLQPAALTKGLTETLPDQIEIFENSPVAALYHKANGVTLKLEQGEIHARNVILAVNAFMPRLGIYRDRVFPLALSASLTRPLSGKEEQEIGNAASWGVLSPQALGATLRLTTDRRLLIRNTAEYRPGGIDASLLAQRQSKHYDGLKRRFPWLANDAIDYTWSGTICVSRNSKPVFGAVSDRVFAAGCYNASGVSRGTVMGKLIAELALREPSDLLDKALSIRKPDWIPPRPFFDIVAKARMALERFKGHTES